VKSEKKEIIKRKST